MSTATAPLFMLCGAIDNADDPYSEVADWLASAPAGVTFDALEIDGDGYDVEWFAARSGQGRPVGLRARIEQRKAS